MTAREPFLRFGHESSARAFWRKLVRRALPHVPTPFYIFAIEPVQEALNELRILDALRPIRVRHWLSCKTQPVPALLRWWLGQGHNIEVVSEFEFLAALREGFAPERILVNGPAKHRWLPRHPLRELNVNFDSLTELDALLPLAKKLHWRVGVRCHTREEFDPEFPEFPTQFGLQAAEAVAALKRLVRARARIETVHFHLRTNVASPAIYERALGEIASICHQARFRPRFLDCGGGLPPPHVLTTDGRPYQDQFCLDTLHAVYCRTLAQFEGLEELWLENGRFLTARSGVLVVRILDTKERPGLRQLICDGGRTTQALISQWETHALEALPDRRGPARLTSICGATCMAFDRLARRPLSKHLRAGDHLIWMDAGAYHIPWETHFSHGLASVLWHQAGELRTIRKAEPFEAWWDRWERPSNSGV